MIVFPERRVKVHKCVVCGRNLQLDTPASETGVGPECSRKPADVIEVTKRQALKADRRRYRLEVIDLGFTIE